MVEAAIGGGPSSPSIPVADVPGIDWDRWLGPAPAVDYQYWKAANVERPIVITSSVGGRNSVASTDWGAHHVDICSWALRVNGQTEGPLSIGGEAEHPVPYEDGNPMQNN